MFVERVEYRRWCEQQGKALPSWWLTPEERGESDGNTEPANKRASEPTKKTALRLAVEKAVRQFRSGHGRDPDLDEVLALWKTPAYKPTIKQVINGSAYWHGKRTGGKDHKTSLERVGRMLQEAIEYLPWP